MGLSSFLVTVIQKRGRKKRRRRRPEIPLPKDLVMEEILTRLPAKSLMRFKCVSKLWSCHIRSRYFSNRFLTVPSRPRPRLYMCLADLSDYRESVILSLAPDTPSSFLVDHDLTIPRMGGYIMQNLGGFMCYTFPKNPRKPRFFNPATRQLVTLPAAIKSSSNIIPPPGDGNKIVSYFFGHDPVNDQYKVVCSTGVYLKLLQEARSEHWVFVLKPGRGSWKKVAPDFCPHIPDIRGLCIHGVIYYLAWIGIYNYVIVSFHIRSEEFKTIQVPHNGLSERFKNLSLIDCGGKLTLLDQTNLRVKGMLDSWVLEDAANKEWSRKSLLLQLSQLHLVRNNFIFKVKCTTQNGKLFFIPQDFLSPFHVLCYDLQSNDMLKIEIKGIPDHWISKDKANRRFDLMFMDQSESVIYL